VGPVFNIDGKTAKIQMDSSQAVAVRLKPTTPATATPTPVPTTTPTRVPTATPRPTYTPFPTYKPAPIPTATLRPTYTPRPKPTARVTKSTYREILVVTPTPPRTPKPTRTPNPYNFHMKGLDYSHDGKYQLAINEFTTHIRLAPKTPNIAICIGVMPTANRANTSGPSRTMKRSFS
jgi:hypothetical protein